MDLVIRYKSRPLYGEVELKYKASKKAFFLNGSKRALMNLAYTIEQLAKMEPSKIEGIAPGECYHIHFFSGTSLRKGSLNMEIDFVPSMQELRFYRAGKGFYQSRFQIDGDAQSLLAFAGKIRFFLKAHCLDLRSSDLYTIELGEYRLSLSAW